MRSLSYMTRALRSPDQRYARILEKLGYGKRPETSAAAVEKADTDALEGLRAEYKKATGKKPFHGWGEDTLRDKIAEADKTDENG